MENEPHEDDPITYLTRFAADSLESSRMYHGVTMGLQQQAVTAGDAEALASIASTRAAAAAMVYERLKDDGRLPAGMKLVLGELAQCQAAFAMLMQQLYSHLRNEPYAPPQARGLGRAQRRRNAKR